MNFSKENRHMIDVLFVLTLFFVFALSSLTLVILGANVYRSSVDHMSQNFTDRTSYAYITQKIRQGDDLSDIFTNYNDNGAISIGQIGDTKCCIIRSEVKDIPYTTYLYEYNGYLCELFARSDLDMSESDGTEILKLDHFDIENVNPKLIKVYIGTTDGDEMTLFISTHASSGGDLNE